MNLPPEADAPATWLHVAMPYEFKGASIDRWLLEMSADGGVLRQLGLDASGSVVYRCGPDEFGVWNDEVRIERYSPTTESWSSVLQRDGGVISRERFEAAWAQSRDIGQR